MNARTALRYLATPRFGFFYCVFIFGAGAAYGKADWFGLGLFTALAITCHAVTKLTEAA